MSSYIHFFVRVNDKFAPIGTYGRSTQIYAAFEQLAPWEKVRSLNFHLLDIAKANLPDKHSLLDSISSDRERIQLITTFNNDIDAKLDAIHELEAGIAEAEEFLREVENARSFIGFLYDILDEAQYSSGQLVLDAENYLYVGMECGDYITAEKIETSKI